MTKEEYTVKLLGINLQIGYFDFAIKRGFIDQKTGMEYLLKLKTELEMLKSNKPF